MTVQVTRLPIQLQPDPSRVITRLFVPGEENRVREIIERLLAIPESDVATLLSNLENSFRPLHPDIDKVFLENFEMVKRHLSNAGQLSESRKRFIGACSRWNTRSKRPRCSIPRWCRRSISREYRLDPCGLS